MGSSKRRRYTNAQRQAAVEDAAEMGVCAAARKNRIQQDCVSRCWVDAKDVRKAEKEEAPKPQDTAKRSEKDNGSARVAKQYTPSQREQILEYASEHGVSAAANKHEVSRYS